MKSDRRVRYSRMVLKQALLSLMLERPITRITVTEICERAEVNRATFYAHYMDIYDLKEQLENELLESFSRVFIEACEKLGTELLSEEMFIKIFSLLRENSEQCVILLNSDSEIVEKFESVSRDIVLSVYGKNFPNASKERLNAYYLFVSSGCVALVKQWLLYAPDVPVEKVAEEVCAVLQKGIGCLL